jgi:hypothetical protein
MFPRNALPLLFGHAESLVALIGNREQNLFLLI